MKKYYLFILIFCLGYSINFTAQFILPSDNFDRLLALEIAPRANTIDFNSISNYHFFNPFAFNPAMAGIEDKRQFNFDWNRQVNHGVSMSYEQPIANINSAIGIQYEYNVNNSGQIHHFGLAYNYGFHWKENNQLRVGVQLSQINIKMGESSYLPLEKNKWYGFPAIDFGLAFQHKQLRLGVSVKNLAPKKYSKFNEPSGIFIDNVFTLRTVNLSAANTFKLSKKIDWSVAFLMRFNNHELIDDYNYYYIYNRYKNRHDFSSYLSFQKKMTIGTTYRVQVDPVWIGFLGVKLKEKLNLQFSFNIEKRSDSDQPRFWEALAQYQF